MAFKFDATSASCSSNAVWSDDFPQSNDKTNSPSWRFLDVVVRFPRINNFLCRLILLTFRNSNDITQIHLPSRLGRLSSIVNAQTRIIKRSSFLGIRCVNRSGTRGNISRGSIGHLFWILKHLLCASLRMLSEFFRDGSGCPM